MPRAFDPVVRRLQRKDWKFKDEPCLRILRFRSWNGLVICTKIFAFEADILPFLGGAITSLGTETRLFTALVSVPLCCCKQHLQISLTVWSRDSFSFLLVAGSVLCEGKIK